MDNLLSDLNTTEPDGNAGVDPGRPRTGSCAKLPLSIAVAYLVLWQVAPKIRADSIGAIATSSLIALLLAIWISAEYARTERAVRVGLGHLFAAIAIVLPPMILKSAAPYPWKLMFMVPGLTDLGVIWLAASLGALLSRLVREANLIPPVAVVLALVDTWTVLLGGPVQQIMQSKTAAAKVVTQALTVPLPAPRPTSGAAPFALAIGFADFLFIAFFIAAMGRFATNPRAYSRTLLGLLVVLGAYMALLIVTGAAGLPALVPMSAVVLMLNWREFKYTRSEKVSLSIAALLMLVLSGWFYWQSQSPKAKPIPQIAITTPRERA